MLRCWRYIGGIEMVYVLVNFKESIVEVIGVFIMVLGSRIKYILEKFKIDI